MPHMTDTPLSDDGGDLSTKDLLGILHATNVSKEARENALELLYRRYSPHILQLIRTKIRVEEDVWDIHSEVWKWAFERLRNFTWQMDAKTSDPLRSWLLSTTYHKLQEYWRGCLEDPIELIEAQLLYFDRYDTLDGFVSEHPEPQPQPLQERMDWLLTEAQRGLTPLEQKVILLTYYSAKNSRQISELLKITPENVRICRHRAIKKLRDFFAQPSTAPGVANHAPQGERHAHQRQ